LARTKEFSTAFFLFGIPASQVEDDEKISDRDLKYESSKKQIKLECHAFICKYKLNSDYLQGRNE
jgi:hypothetical protein